MTSTLVAWLGQADLDASTDSNEIGPVAQALDDLRFERVVLLASYPKQDCQLYSKWLQKRFDGEVKIPQCPLEDPTNHSAVLGEVDKVVKALRHENPNVDLTFHLSPGTPSMHAIWLLLAKSRYPAKLVQSVRGGGTKEVELPNELTINFRPEILRTSKDDLERLSEILPEGTPKFDEMIYGCESMTLAVVRSQLVAPTDFPVLLLGETGTGKELFAKAIRLASNRRHNEFINVNCSALPSDTIESELFGHERGAFTSASSQTQGLFLAADKGTIFLDEIGDLPISAQAKLLRVLEDGEIRRVGGTDTQKVDVRLIAATHKDLAGMVREGSFREDLLRRIDVGVIHIPPLREREGDLPNLIDHLWEKIEGKLERRIGYQHRILSKAARSLLSVQTWSGNVRELNSVLVRAGLWATGENIDEQDIENALVTGMSGSDRDILGRSIGGEFDLESLMSKVASHYLSRAVKQADGKIAVAAGLIGFSNATKFNSWLEKHAGDATS